MSVGRIHLAGLVVLVTAVPSHAGDALVSERSEFRIVGYLPDYRVPNFDLVTTRHPGISRCSRSFAPRLIDRGKSKGERMHCLPAPMNVAPQHDELESTSPCVLLNQCVVTL